MCIAFFNLSLPGFRLALASNRDEFLGRDALPAAWHDGSLSGVDVAGGVGGTWLGVSETGRVAALLNIRDDNHPPKAPTRGLLVKRYLSDETIAAEELQAYEGCNLLTFDLGSKPGIGEVLSNRGKPKVDLSLIDGWRGISNSSFDEPWIKVLEGVRELQGGAGTTEAVVVEALFAVLRRSVPLDNFEDRMRATLVPAVNLGTAEAPKWYGTRVSTVVLVRDDGSAIFIERDVLEADVQQGWRRGTGERRFDFKIQQR